MKKKKKKTISFKYLPGYTISDAIPVRLWIDPHILSLELQVKLSQMILIHKILWQKNNVISVESGKQQVKLHEKIYYICQIIWSFMAHLQGFSDVRAKQEVITFERQPTFLRRSPALHFCMISFVSASSLEDFSAASAFNWSQYF